METLLRDSDAAMDTLSVCEQNPSQLGAQRPSGGGVGGGGKRGGKKEMILTGGPGSRRFGSWLWSLPTRGRAEWCSRP